jgi:hypothetical protein
MASNELYDAAIEAIERGWSIFPLGYDKRPIGPWKKYQTQAPTREEVDDWFEKGAPTEHGDRVRPFNLALVTGELSGIVVVDCDNADAVAYARKYNLSTSISVATSRGRHFYWSHPRGGRRYANKVGGSGKDWPSVSGLDFRGDGGYVVFPPSVRISEDGEITHTYAWEIGIGLTIDDLDGYLWRGNPTSTEGSAGGFDFNSLDLSTYRTADPNDGLPVYEQAQLLIARLGRKLEEGDGRNAWLIRFAGSKVRQGVHGDALRTACGAFQDEFFDTPLPYQEVETVLASAVAMDRRNHPDDYESDGTRKTREVETSGGKFVPIYIDAVERLLSSIGEEVYFADPLIPEGTIVQIAGYNGHGKSYFIKALMTAIAAGKPSFGPFELRPGKVFYLDWDNPRRTILNRMQDFAEMFGSPGHNLAVWSPTLISPEDGGEMNLLSPEGANLLGEWLKVVQPSIVVIDTVRNAFRGLEEQKAEEWAKVNHLARTLRNRLGCTVVLVHHRNKPGEGGLGREAGSTAQLTDIDTQAFITQVYERKEDAKARAGLLDGDLEVNSLHGTMTPWTLLTKAAGADARVLMVMQIAYGKIRQQTELHETHYIGFAESLLSGNRFIVSTMSRKQKAIALRSYRALNAGEIARKLFVPQREVERWIGGAK